MYLVADVGGTNVRLALKERKKEGWIEKRSFSTETYPSLEAIVTDFLTSLHVSINSACFAIAAPVRGESVKLTNAPWEINFKKIKKELGIESLYFINDLVAHAYGIELVKGEELLIVQKGKKTKEGNRAVIAAGTGLGEAGVVMHHDFYIPFASEGGHQDFAPRNELEVELFLTLKKEIGHVSTERLVSGRGIAKLYSFLVDTKREKPDPLIEGLEEEVRPPEILSQGLLQKSSICSRVLDWFLSLYGRETANVALSFFATQGVYICGALAASIAPKFQGKTFITAFLDKGRFSSFLHSIPVYVVLNKETALLGGTLFLEKQL
jgi:glucokinase